MEVVNKSVIITKFRPELYRYLIGRHDYKEGPPHINDGKIYAMNGIVDLMMRFKPPEDWWPSRTLIVARMGFMDKNKGHGTDFLKFLRQTIPKYQYKNIGLENVNKSARGFADRMGFTEVYDNSNFIVSIKKLSKINKS